MAFVVNILRGGGVVVASFFLPVVLTKHKRPIDAADSLSGHEVNGDEEWTAEWDREQLLSLQVCLAVSQVFYGSGSDVFVKR